MRTRTAGSPEGRMRDADPTGAALPALTTWKGVGAEVKWLTAVAAPGYCPKGRGPPGWTR